MTDAKDPVYRMLWTENLEEVDREIAKLATLCQIRILEPDVMRRVLQKDASVCGVQNPEGFAKLHDLLMLHMGVRQKLVDSYGQAQTAAIEDTIIERLRKAFPDLAGRWPPA
jgi:hypothetical protein